MAGEALFGAVRTQTKRDYRYRSIQPQSRVVGNNRAQLILPVRERCDTALPTLCLVNECLQVDRSTWHGESSGVRHQCARHLIFIDDSAKDVAVITSDLGTNDSPVALSEL